MKVTPIDAPLPLDGINRNLRVVVLDCPYDTIQNEQTQGLFAKLAALKIAGYQAEYPYGALPLDTTDFIAVHLLLCEERSGNLLPLMGFKSVTAKRCAIHNIPFPAHGVLRGNDLPEYEKALDEIISTSRSKGQEIAYNSSLTVHPDARHDKQLRQLCTDMTVALFVKYYQEYKIPNVIAAATLRFKVQVVKEFAGFEYLSLNGSPLPPFDCKPFFGEKVALMHLRQFRDEAKFWANRYSCLWDNRLTISTQKKIVPSIAEAA
ncbi:hypothetical protein WDW37_17335 [Bdellovibrionota bacterium FG-1]